MLVFISIGTCNGASHCVWWQIYNEMVSEMNINKTGLPLAIHRCCMLVSVSVSMLDPLSSYLSLSLSISVPVLVSEACAGERKRERLSVCLCTIHRKKSVSFRDKSLLQIFQVAMQTLGQLVSGSYGQIASNQVSFTRFLFSDVSWKQASHQFREHSLCPTPF